MLSLTIVILLFVLVIAGLWMVIRFSSGGELKKQHYHRMPAPAPNKKRRA